MARQYHRLTRLTGKRYLLRLGVATLAALSLSATVPAAAQASTDGCWSRTYAYSVKINKAWHRDKHVPYGVSFHWCGSNGNVTSFVVDSTYGQDVGVKVDVRPYHPLAFGRAYPIFINGSKDGFLDHHEITLQPGIAGQL